MASINPGTDKLSEFFKKTLDLSSVIEGSDAMAEHYQLYFGRQIYTIITVLGEVN